MVLKVVELTKRFSFVKAVDRFSFQVGKGEVVGLVGPNGSGKTTTIDCVTGLQNPDSGQIIINGHDLHKEPEKAKMKIAYVPEMPFLLLEDLSVIENIRFASKAYFHDNWKDTAERLIRGFDLQDKRRSAVKNLSKGQKQKTAIICAFCHEPDLIFFDEPLIGIDPKGGKLLKDLIREHCEKGGSVLISTHMLDVIREICDRVIILNKGKAVARGTFQEITDLVNHRLESRGAGKDVAFEDVFIKITEGESASFEDD